jgi:hypothetical protein
MSTSTPTSMEARERALDALALSRREGLSLTRAARLTHTTRRTVLRHAGRGFRHEGRRYRARPFDRIPREIAVLTAGGPERITVHDSRTASLIAEHANAVRRYLRTGDDTELRALRRAQIVVRGRRIALPVDPELIDRLAAGGELHFELYRR